MGFASRVKELRKRKGISKDERVELIKVSFTQVSRYNGRKTKANAKAMTKPAPNNLLYG